MSDDGDDSGRRPTIDEINENNRRRIAQRFENLGRQIDDMVVEDRGWLLTRFKIRVAGNSAMIVFALGMAGLVAKSSNSAQTVGPEIPLVLPLVVLISVIGLAACWREAAVRNRAAKEWVKYGRELQAQYQFNQVSELQDLDTASIPAGRRLIAVSFIAIVISAIIGLAFLFSLAGIFIPFVGQPLPGDL